MEFKPLSDKDVTSLLAETRQSIASREEKVNVITTFLNSNVKSAQNVESFFPRALNDKHIRSLSAALKTIVRDEKLPMVVTLSKVYGLCFVKTS